MAGRLATIIGSGFLTALVTTLAGEALAAESAWLENEGGRVRLVVAAHPDDGTVRGFIDIDLKPGWKTYWRDPGDSGIPPRLDADSGKAALHFPPPVRIEHEYADFIGYERSVRLPLTLEADGDTLNARVFLGICEEICVPVQETFTLRLDGTAGPLQEAMIEAAFAGLPAPPAPDFHIADASLSEDGSLISVTAVLPSEAAAEGSAELFVTAPEGLALGVPVKTGHDGHRALFEVPVQRLPEGRQLSGEELTLLVKTLSQSVEETVTLP